MLKILVAYSIPSTQVQTTMDYLSSLKRLGGAEVSFVHVTHGAALAFDLEEFDVIFHNYCARLCFEGYVSESYRGALMNFRGLKILAVQDEYDNTNVLKEAIKDLGFHIVLTSVPQSSLEYVYSRNEFPDVEFVTVLTGYVPDDFAAHRRPSVPLADRPYVIGYRGRDIGGRYGRLGFDKFEIGRRMKEICEDRNIAHDIAVDEASRIYGSAWFDFVGSCRAMLGSESGSNVFDFDGSLLRAYNDMAAARGGRVPYEEFLPIVADRESGIEMGQISPRVFECALMKTAMVLFRGRYSDAIQPDIHYIPLEKDFSNIDEVFTRLENLPELSVMVDRTYEHLIASGNFSYRLFRQGLELIIARGLTRLDQNGRSRARTYRTPPTRAIARGLIARGLLAKGLAEVATAQPLGMTEFRPRERKYSALMRRKKLLKLVKSRDLQALLAIVKRRAEKLVLRTSRSISLPTN
jgi:hypothetical protein